MRLQNKILLLLVPLIVLPLLILGWTAYTLLMEDARARTQHQVTTLLEQIRFHTESLMQTARANASLFASAEPVMQYVQGETDDSRKAELKQEVLELLFNYQIAYPEYYEIRILSPEGHEELRSVIGGVQNLSTDESSTAYFQGTRDMPGVIYTTFFNNPDNNKPALLASKPLTVITDSSRQTDSHGKLLGYLTLTVDLGILQNIAHSEKVGASGRVFFTDASGRILFHPMASEVGSRIPEALFGNLTRATDRLTPFDHESDGRLLHYQGIKLHDWMYAFAVYDDDEFIAKSVSLGRSVTIITCIAIIVTIVFLLGILRTLLIKPIQQLSIAAREMGHGQVLVPINVESDDEIGDLANTFREMGENLNHYHEQVRYVAYHDSLTGLPNRLMFKDYLRRAPAEARRNHQELTLIFLDLDNFKRINDTLGHQAGDALLEAFADRLSGCLRQTDVIAHGSHDDSSSVMARLAGDEFIIMLPRTTGSAQAQRVAMRILESLTAPFIINKQELHISTSIGIALYPDDGRNADDLIKNADIAMYHAKKTGRNNYQFYSSKMNEQALYKLRIESRLRHAVENNELEIHYQPQVNLATGMVTGAESLIRWRDSDAGMIPPDVFIPIAEEYGLIIPISEWLIHEACRQAQAWLDLYNSPITIALNISAIQLNGSELTRLISKTLQATGYDPRLLELELTEGSILKDPEFAIETLGRLQSMGLQTSLDDFGTGYSSLNYLMRLPLDKLKIDRSFIQNLDKDARGKAIVSAIIAMAHSLDLEVIAEGIEEVAHLELLRGMKCDIVQGYHIARPMPAIEFEKMFATGLQLVG
ncbi:MAG: EAL domain-containing protein [Gammaproteobacteria bacterium]